MATDIRVLSLRKIITPQTVKLDELLKKGQGDYVSFQDFQLIDISYVHNSDSEEALWENIYDRVNQTEKKRHDEVRICQSMVLYQDNEDGTASKFWNRKQPELLYISMLQLVNSAIDLSQIRDNIRTAFSRENILESNWSLYYSLDFCDLVLFTKNTESDRLRKALRSLVSGNSTEDTGSNKSRIFRDASTQTAISKRLVLRSFKEICEIAHVDAIKRYLHDDKYDVQFILEANLQQNSWIIEVLKKLEDRYVFTEMPTRYRTFGHYDIGILFPVCKLRLLLYLVFLLNQNLEEGFEKSIGAYEIHIICEDTTAPQNTYQQIPADDSLYCITKKELVPRTEGLRKKTGTPELNDAGCAYEIAQSLLVSLKSGFCEEFALCLLEPLSGYLGAVNGILSQIKEVNRKITKTRNLESYNEGAIQKRRLEEAAWSLIRSFTKAVSMIAQATMHNDGEFVYTPAFQTRVFEVPPKLLALYEVAAHKIQDLLRDSSEQNQQYYFLFNPDYRSDIFVEIISPDDYEPDDAYDTHVKGRQQSNNISVVFISEKLMYNPSGTLALLCHEIAHQVGSKKRKRKERTEYLFQSISILLLDNTFIGIHRESYEELLRTLSKALGECITEEYENTRTEKVKSSTSTLPQKSPLLYYSKDVEQFIVQKLKEPSYDGDLPFLSDNAIPTLRKALQTLSENARTQMRTHFLKWMNPALSLENIQSDDYWPSDEIILKAMLVQMSSYIKRKNGSDYGYQDSYEYSDRISAIFSCFREAYSDLRMIELMKIDQFEDYLKIRRITRPDLDEEMYYEIRSKAIEQLLSVAKISFKNKEQELIVECLVNYLKECKREDLRKRDDIISMDKSVTTLDGEKSFTQIRKILQDYRSELTQSIIKNALC